MKIRLSTGNSRTDKRWNLVEMELDEFRERISAYKPFYIGNIPPTLKWTGLLLLVVISSANRNGN